MLAWRWQVSFFFFSLRFSLPHLSFPSLLHPPSLKKWTKGMLMRMVGGCGKTAGCKKVSKEIKYCCCRRVLGSQRRINRNGKMQICCFCCCCWWWYCCCCCCKNVVVAMILLLLLLLAIADDIGRWRYRQRVVGSDTEDDPPEGGVVGFF